MRAESELADFCIGLRAGDIPDEARKRAVDALTDCVACAIAGATQPLARSVLQTIYTARECPGVLIGAAARAPAPDAALYNGAVAHGASTTMTSVIPRIRIFGGAAARLAVLRGRCRVTGRDLVTAYVIGIEVFGKLGRTLNLHTTRNGCTDSTFGAMQRPSQSVRCCAFRAAVAVGDRPRGLGFERLAVQFGTMAKPRMRGMPRATPSWQPCWRKKRVQASAEALRTGMVSSAQSNGGAGISLERFSGWGGPFESSPKAVSG